MVKPEVVVADVEMADVEVAKKKKKKSKKEAVEPEVAVEAGKKRAASSDEAEDAPKKKKKKKSADAEAVEAVPAVTEEADSEKAEKKKKKKKKSEEEEASSPAPTASTKEDSDAEEEKPAAAETEEAQESKTVFVGGLPWTATEEQVKKDFEECGEVTEFRFPLDRDTQQPKGIAFVVYATAEGVKKALEFNETEYGGRTIYVRVDEGGSKGGKKGKDGKGKGKGKDGKGKGKKGELMQPGEKPDGCMSIIVKNCSWETTEESLRATFEACGDIRRVNMMTNDEGTFRGMCFIDYESTEAVDEAIKKCNTDLDGRMIFVDYAGAKPAKGKDGKGKGKDGKGKGKKGKGKGKGKKGGDPTYAARNGSIQESSGTAASFDSDSE